jgi:protein arginine kinase activator
MMFETICDECKSKPAYRRILETKDGVKRYIYVCRDCYYNKQKNATIKLMDNIAIKTITPTQTTRAQSVCSKCNTTESEFVRTSILGCENCYIDLVRPILKMIKSAQGGFIHKGKSPYDAVSSENIIKLNSDFEKSKPAKPDKPTYFSQHQALKDKLEKAIRDEDFELACQLRDQLNTLDTKEESDAGVDEK